MKKICIISSDPSFLGGVSIYTWSFVNSLKKDGENEIFWVYGGKKNKIYKKDGITMIELETKGFYPFNELQFNFKIKEFLRKNQFDIVNSHAIWGLWMKNYHKKKNQEIIHTYHGSTYYFFRNHLKRPSISKKIISFFSMFLGSFMERPSWKTADEIICVSEHVKKELEGLYGKRRNVNVVHAEIDLKRFKPRNKKSSKKRVGLDEDKWYGLYVGRGGFWTKGLDRVVKLSQEIYKKDEKYRLLIVGADKGKVKDLINKKFIIFFPPASREILPYYYNSSDIFFNLSRYEGGDPTLSTAEAMASGCFIICSRDSKQEIIKDGKNGLVIGENYKKEVERILRVMKSKRGIS